MTVLRNYNTLKQFKKEQVHPKDTICFIKDSGIIHSNGLDYTHAVMSSIDSMTDSDSVLFKFNQLKYQLINSGLMYDPNEKHTITFYVETARDFFLLPSIMSTDTVDKSAIQKDPTGPSERVYQLWLHSEYPWSGTANARPSGEYQAPTGFELRVSNGEPASAMEMLYVLANNYKYTITVNPGNGSKSGETLEPEEISVTSLEELDLLDNEEIEYTEESFDDPIYTEIIEDGKVVSIIDGDLTGAEVLTTQNININIKTKEEES